MPFFSVIIPTYNRRATLPRAIKSVLEQSCSDFELIIVDDGSNDGTPELVAAYLDHRILFEKQENRGVSSARNLGASLANGNYLIFLDSDDEFLPGYLENVMSYVHSDPDIIFAGVEWVKKGRVISYTSSTKPYGKVSHDGLFLAGTFIVRKSHFLEIGGYDINLHYAENTELSIRLSQKIVSKVFIERFFLRIYQQSSELRASVCHRNIITALIHILAKHRNYYNQHPQTRWIYLNIIGVSMIKVGKLRNGRSFLFESIKVNPWGWKAYIRLGLSFVPGLSINKFKEVRFSCH